MKSLADVYSSLRLEQNQTRLLVVEPGRWCEEITCSLEILSLDGSYNHEALSYVWGNPEDTVPIHVNGFRFDATRNLYCALRRLRKNSAPRKIWVDAICINQHDLDERGAQVSIMREIYCKASVLVSFGESLATAMITAEEQRKWQMAPQDVWHKNEVQIVNLLSGGWTLIDPPEGITDQSRVWDFFQRQLDVKTSMEEDKAHSASAVQALQQADSGAFAIISTLAHGRCLKDCLQSDTDNPAWTAALKALSHLARNPWWTRAWTLQEAVVAAKRTAFYGNIVAPLDLIVEAGAQLDWHCSAFRCCKNFVDKLPRAQRDILDEFLRPTSALSVARQEFYAGWGLDNQLTKLRFYLDVIRLRKATDARDKIYALLGLVKYRHDPIDIYPNYRKAASELYTDVAMLMIRHSHSLDILLTNELKRPKSDLPTWVPHWGPLPFNQLDDLAVRQRALHFQAGRSFSDSARLCGKIALAVQAGKVGRIADVGFPLMQGPDDHRQAMKQLLKLTGADRNPDAPYIGGGTVYNAFWRTMLGDLLLHDGPDEYSYTRLKPSDAAAFSSVLEGYDTNSYMASQDPITMAIYSEEQRQAVAEHFASISKSFWKANNHRMFFRTENGYIGLGPPELKIGDQVFVLLGCKMPLILRPAATPHIEGIPKHHYDDCCYNQVGYSYVHGIMDGEAVAGYLNHESKGNLDEPGNARANVSNTASKSGGRLILSTFARVFGGSARRKPHQIFLV